VIRSPEAAAGTRTNAVIALADHVASSRESTRVTFSSGGAATPAALVLRAALRSPRTRAALRTLSRALSVAAGILLAAHAPAVTPGSAMPSTPDEGPAIVTYHGDLARTGWTQDERALTPAAVRGGKFGEVWTAALDGEIRAEPLVVPGVAMLGRVRTVLYVVTERDTVYALDAAGGSRLWGPVSLGDPVPRAAIPCADVDPAGITGTPVLDRGSGTLYVVGLVSPDGGRTTTYRIGALDLKSGMERPGWPVALAPAAPGSAFDPAIQRQRGALTLTRRVVYVPFGGRGEGCRDARGWIVAVPTSAPSQQRSFATPVPGAGGIESAGGIAADAAGNLYAATGGGDSIRPGDLGSSVVRFRAVPPRGPVGAPGDGLAPSGAIALQPAPAGPGGSALLLLPDQHTSAMRRLLFVTGAQGMVYLVDRDRIAGLTGGRGAAGSSVSSRCVFGPCGGGPGGIPADAAYWDGGARAGPMVFVPGRGPQPPPCSGTGGVVALRLRAGGESSMPRLDVAWCSASMHDPGAPSVSGVGPAGVVWVTDQDETPVLRALDAGTGAPLYESRIPAGGGAAQPPVTPAVAGGRVYVAAGHLVRAFGLW